MWSILVKIVLKALGTGSKGVAQPSSLLIHAGPSGGKHQAAYMVSMVCLGPKSSKYLWL